MDDQTYWHEGEPRIIASGRWEQDEYGDTSYIPDHIRPSTAPPADPDAAPIEDLGGDLGGERTGADGYRIRSDAVWTAARRDYLAGDAAEAVCVRYDLKLGTLRSRAAREGWRRSDIEDVWPDPRDEDPNTPAPDLTQMATQALMRLNRALQRGRAVEAASWLRTWRALTDPALLAAATPDSGAKAEPTPAPPRHPGAGPARSRRRRPRRRRPLPRRPRRPPRHRSPPHHPQNPPRSRGRDFRRFRRIGLCFFGGRGRPSMIPK